MGNKILMLLSNEFNPDVRVEKEAIALGEAGYAVRIIAWKSTGSMREEETRSSYYIVHRIRASWLKGKIGRALWFPLFWSGSLLRGLKEHADIVHSHDLDTLPAGIMIAKITGVPLVYDAHEHYAKMIEQDVPGWLVKQVDRLEMILAGKADLVVAANIKIAEYLAPISKKVVVVMNCVDVVPTPGLRNKGSEEGLVLLYAGALEPLRFIEELMEIVSRDKRLKLRIAGSGSLQGAVERMAQRNANILFLGRLSRDAVGMEIANADAIVALLDPSNENNRIGTPNRLFEGMAAGVPVLVSAGTFSAKIVQDCGCGLAVDWKKSELNEALQVLMVPSQRKQMGENGILATETQYNWKRMKDILVDNYLDLLDGNTLNRNSRSKEE